MFRVLRVLGKEMAERERELRERESERSREREDEDLGSCSSRSSHSWEGDCLEGERGRSRESEMVVGRSAEGGGVRGVL